MIVLASERLQCSHHATRSGITAPWARSRRALAVDRRRRRDRLARATQALAE
jgi:hypothetical protein